MVAHAGAGEAVTAAAGLHTEPDRAGAVVYYLCLGVRDDAGPDGLVDGSDYGACSEGRVQGEHSEKREYFEREEDKN